MRHRMLVMKARAGDSGGSGCKGKFLHQGTSTRPLGVVGIPLFQPFRDRGGPYISGCLLDGPLAIHERIHCAELLMTAFEINGRRVESMSAPDTPLLWVIRDDLRLTGTKFGCGIGQCGSCTVHLEGVAVRSCQIPLSLVEGKRVTTIEGLSDGGDHPVQLAWIEEQVPQCGYCQSGQLMAAAALLSETPRPTDADIDDAMSGNLCRCGTYQRIRRAVHRAAAVGA